MSETHLAVWCKKLQAASEPRPVEQQDNAGDDDEHHCQISPHREHHREALAYYRGPAAGCKRDERQYHGKCHRRYYQNFLPEINVAVLIVEQPSPAYQHTCKEKEYGLCHPSVLNRPGEIHRKSVNQVCPRHIEERPALLGRHNRAEESPGS